MGDREAQKTFWQRYSATPSIETMMLNNNAEKFDEHDRRDIWSSLPDLTRLKVVELGSGIGRFTAILASLAKHVLATDFIQSFIEKNEKENGYLGNVQFKCVDAVHLNLESESCDFVFTNWLLMYLTDVEVAHFLRSVLRWLTPNGYLHFRESCSESSKRTQTKPNDSNPTHYRHICQYLALIDKIRVRDSQSGRLVRFKVLWAKSVETYVMVIRNWCQVHMLLQKVWADDTNGEAMILDEPTSIQLLREFSLNGKNKFERAMSLQSHVWGARSPFEIFLLKSLQEDSNLSSSDTILTSFGNNGAAISPFAVAETFGCFVYNLDTNFWMYDYNLTQANAKGNTRIRFQYSPCIAGDAQIWQLVPDRYFSLIVASSLLEECADLEDILAALEKKLKPGARIILLERLDAANVGIVESYARTTAMRYFSVVEVQDVTPVVNGFLKAADMQLGQEPELQELQMVYQQWLQADQMAKWCIISAKSAKL